MTRTSIRAKAAALMAVVALALGAGVVAAGEAAASPAHWCRYADPACNG
ncbi:hypothetical protein ACIQUQ_10495 [Streptomyces sp. NPDC101118]